MPARQWRTVDPHPLTKHNAHKFKPNQPNGIPNCTSDDLFQYLYALAQTPTDTWHTVYFHDFHQDDTTTAALNWANECADKLIVVDSSDHVLYHTDYHKRGGRDAKGNPQMIDAKTWQEDFINKYFLSSKQRWKDLQLTNVWDDREFMALNFRPFNRSSMQSRIRRSRPYFLLKGPDLWTSFDHNLSALFEYIGAEICHDRMDQWLQVYKEWRPFHHQRLMFCFYFESIIQNILNGNHMDLTRFHLDIEQEAAIQHALIYRHNLNFRTWQLERFLDTKQLHDLLEPNIHPLERTD
jgi:hypothetical protein